MAEAGSPTRQPNTALIGGKWVDVAEIWPAPDVRERWEKLMALLAPQPGEMILDVGFGGGQAVRYLADRVGPDGHVVGIESNTTAVAGLRATRQAQGIVAVELLQADAQHLPFADEAFDAVLCVNVLEAVPDRRRALTEMRRVLKTGGRALVAHDDYESQVYASTDRELARRITLAYASATFDVYAASDGQMGRHLWGHFRAAGFRDPVLRVVPLVNTEYREPLLGWVLAQFPATLVAAVSDLTEEDLDRWRIDLAERSARGEYAYCLNLYACLGRK